LNINKNKVYKSIKCLKSSRTIIRNKVIEKWRVLMQSMSLKVYHQLLTIHYYSIKNILVLEWIKNIGSLVRVSCIKRKRNKNSLEKEE
jgi:hypothetical protein